jgi:hypothetical protein
MNGAFLEQADRDARTLLESLVNDDRLTEEAIRQIADTAKLIARAAGSYGYPDIRGGAESLAHCAESALDVKQSSLVLKLEIWQSVVQLRKYIGAALP